MTHPPYGRFDLYGRPVAPPPVPPPNRNLLPWLIVGGAVLLSGLGILLVLLLRGDGTGNENAAANSTAPAPTTSASASPHREPPGGAQVADRNTGAGQARFAGSDQVALTWVRAMAGGDFQTAYGLSCAAVRQSAADTAAGGDPVSTLGTYFFDHTLSGQRITQGSFDSIMFNQASDSDIASFTLQLDNSEEFLLLVYVQSDGTVCDFI